MSTPNLGDIFFDLSQFRPPPLPEEELQKLESIAPTACISCKGVMTVGEAECGEECTSCYNKWSAFYSDLYNDHHYY